MIKTFEPMSDKINFRHPASLFQPLFKVRTSNSR